MNRAGQRQGGRNRALWDPVNGSRWAPLKTQAHGTTRTGMMWGLCGFPSMWRPREQSPQAGWPAPHAWLTGEAGGTDGGGLVQLPQAARLHLGRHSQERPTTAWRGGQHGCGHDRRGGVLMTVRRTGGQQVCAEAGKGAPPCFGGGITKLECAQVSTFQKPTFTLLAVFSPPLSFPMTNDM